MNDHSFFMRRAIELAKKGMGLTKSNPLVGAVLVKGNQIIAEGFHEYFGAPHAEASLLSKVSSAQLVGTDLYCTLEPCCHLNKKTPPCAQSLLNKGIQNIYIANLDPNPEVAGKGSQLLKDNGINVEIGIESKLAEKLNFRFFKSFMSELPYIHCKIAQSLDGKFSLSNGDSKWITSNKSRELTHTMRALNLGIMVSGETVRNDSPQLTVRNQLANHPSFKQPRPIIISKDLSLDCGNLKNRSPLVSGKLDNKEDWTSFLTSLKKEKGISSIFIEPGAKLFSKLLQFELIDELSVFIAPTFIGNGRGLNDPLVEKIESLKRYENYELITHLEGDILMNIQIKEYSPCLQA